MKHTQRFGKYNCSIHEFIFYPEHWFWTSHSKSIHKTQKVPIWEEQASTLALVSNFFLDADHEPQ